MRLHHLTVSAFGPFAGTERVDFDELNDAGLFLLTGPTGAGKSSLLDAVCFALYGTVPGSRGTKTLKSHHAPVDARPEVVLDFTLRHRRFTVRRSPEWTRPKRRGDGVLTEKASASLLETTDGTEHLLSSRAAEVGLLLGGLVGMSASQFVQVALLPQGQFQTFLQASSQDRHAVLQQLFRTDRFARIEDWVHDHSRQLKDQARSGHETVQRILDTIADRCGSALPDELCGDLLPAAAADGRVRAWVDKVTSDATAAAVAAAAAHVEACAASEQTVERRQAAARRQEVLVRRTSARRVLDELARTEAEATQARESLDLDDRASRCRPVLALVDRAATEAADARVRSDATLRRLASSGLAVRLGRSPSTDDLLAVAEELRADTARAEALLPREDAAATARRDLAAARRRLAGAEARLSEAGRRAAALPAQVEAVVDALATATARSARQEALELSLAAARERHSAAVAVDEARDRLELLEERHRDARDRAQDARDRVQDLLARRLAGMAAELAGSLVEGAPCQVCGSTDHPRPAAARVDAVSDTDHAEAEQAFAACAELRDESARLLQDARHRHLSLLDASGGLSAAEAAEQLVSLQESLADARRATEEQADLEAGLASLRREQEELVERRAETTAQIAALRTTTTDLESTAASIEDEIAAAVGDSRVGLRDLVADLRRLTALVVDAHHAGGLLDAAEDRLAATSGQAREVVVEHGFPDPASVREALLPQPERARLESWLQERDRVAVRAQTVLDDPEQVALEEHPQDDLAALDALVARAEGTAAASARERHLLEERAAALTSARDRLCTALEDWSPLRDRSLRAESMARLIRGTGQDNQLQMRLSAYVLATRLDSVLAAANERLAHLRDQRYLLQRSARTARKGTPAGLGLEVVDQWTGDVRDPATLSGGETFVVSLSLALGLADVVTQEAGGTEIETLFVDEGFGTLDADTLDDVMDGLDGLRAGGRTVGVVSHVHELRNRIPTQVHVHKGRSGSSVAVRTLVG